MTAPYKIGDKVKPLPYYPCNGMICGQKCKVRFKENSLYNDFKAAEIIFIHESGNVDIQNNHGIWYDVQPEKLEIA